MTKMVEQFILPNNRSILLRRVPSQADLSAALMALDVRPGGPVIVVVGGAGKLSTVASESDPLPNFFLTLAEVAEQNAAVVIDGGTDAGVMALMGQARAKLGGTFPLLGVAASGTIDLDLTLGRSTESGYQAPLEPHHSHFLLVPGDNWGDEALWISDVATALADPARCVTVLVNGGPIARDDVRHSLDAKRPVLVVAGTGRLADELAAEPDRPPLLAVIEVTTPKAMVKAKLQALLQG